MGKLIQGDYYFFDDLKYESGEKWDYCKGEDRRFNYERNNGIRPAGQTQLKNDPEGEKHIPAGTYDTGDGFYDPIRSLVFSFDGRTILRTPTAYEVDWIQRTCRYNPRDTREPITGVSIKLTKQEDKIITRVIEMQDEKRSAVQAPAKKETPKADSLADFKVNTKPENKANINTESLDIILPQAE